MTESAPSRHHFRPQRALEQLPGDQGEARRVLFEHGSLELEIYAPRAHDPQEPHDRDEIKESRFPAPACGGRRLRSTAFHGRTTPLVPLASRATASLGRFFGCAKTATSLSPALDLPNRGRRVAFGSYVVISGCGTFLNGSQRNGFGPGDLLLVPAGTVHRFEDFSDDFATWVIFYGPPGGE